MQPLASLYRQSFKTSANVALRSPPDVFAVCAYFAKASGCYLSYAQSSSALRSIVSAAKAEGADWRVLLDQYRSPPVIKVPPGIRKAWALLGQKIGVSMDSLAHDVPFVEAVLFLIVAADEACVGIGIPGSKTTGSYFELGAEAGITKRGTLCRTIPSSSVRILPKQHTPTSGFNHRSLTHHLAFCSASEVEPVWIQMPRKRINNGNFNVLMAPWPLALHSSDIKPSRRRSSIPRRFGYFDFAPRGHTTAYAVRKWIQALFVQAKQIGQKLDLLVLPELALTELQWREVSKIASRHGVTIISGVRVEAKDCEPGDNLLKVKAPYSWHSEIVQYKHHRWQIDPGQILNYGLGGTLNRSLCWWENIKVRRRRLNFLAFNENLVLCPLICEDLARQDPVAELVRSVGPNLVVALLMDGPQLPDRWSARYATVLADDPGSSVITISGLGMVRLSRPGQSKASRVFGSWKDAFGRFTPLELAEGETALILNLQFQKQEEISVDGRSDGGATSVPVLCGIHPLTA